jgi:peptidoglycan/xylan/chitin deacetylase (PgdA/CDA1 family)
MLKRILINLFDTLGLLDISRYLHRNTPVILMYHRITDHPLLPGISPEVFQEQMHYLKKKFRVISINQLISEIASNTVKPNTVAITFDDGHQDFYSNAWPILREEKIPAALYITTDFIDKKQMLWPDVLRYLLINSSQTELQLDDLGYFSLASDNDKLLTWNILGNYCLTLSSSQREVFFETLAKRLDIEWISEAHKPFLPVSWEEIKKMQSEGLIIGSHTVSHPILSKITEAELREELDTSYRVITQRTGEHPLGICYPNGMATDISAVVTSQASSIYQYGLVAFPGGISKNNMMQLGRKAAPKTLWQFKQIINGLNFHENVSGSYQ